MVPKVDKDGKSMELNPLAIVNLKVQLLDSIGIDFSIFLEKE